LREKLLYFYSIKQLWFGLALTRSNNLLKESNMTNTTKKQFEEYGTIVTKPSMKLIGITAGPTDNQKEMQGEGVIPQLWGRFTAEQIPAKVPNQTGSGQIIAAYYNIESDDRGPYSFFIGMEVSSFDEVPEGMTSLEVPADQYLEVSTKTGSFQTIGMEAWMWIWSSEELRKSRTFGVDIEVYGTDAQDQENARFDIYVGVK
jgi:predicted transcriptional regulator YdeE